MDSCIAPEQIPDWQLEAYLDGEDTPELKQHLAVCASCTRRLAELEGLTRSLKSALSRAICPDVDELRAYKWKHLPPEQALAIENHLVNCLACRREVLSFSGPSPSSASSGTDAAGTFARQIRLLVGKLTPAPAMKLPQVRGTGSKTMLYEIQESGWQLVLEEVTESRGYVLFGQLLGPEAALLASAQAMALAGGVIVREADLDPSGWFALRPLTAGSYELWIDTADTRVRIRELEIGEPPPALTG